MKPARESPLRILEYHAITKIAGASHLGFCVLFGGLFLLGLAGAVLAPDAATRDSLRGSLIPTGFTFAIHVFLYLAIVRPAAKTRLLIFPDRLEVEGRSGHAVYPFADLAEVKGYVSPYFGGAFELRMKSGAGRRFGALLMNAGALLDAIAEFEPRRRRELAELRANLIVFHHGCARIQEYFRGAYALVAIVPLVFAWLLARRQNALYLIPFPKSFYFHTALSIIAAAFTLAVFAALVLNWMIDRRTVRRLRENPLHEARDRDYERRLFRDALPVYLFALFALFGAYGRFDLNLLSRTRTDADVPHLGLEAGAPLWIDERANCLGCARPLRSGDRVVFLRDGSATLGRLVGVPGSLIAISGSGNERALASTSEGVPAGKVAIASKADGSLVELVDLRTVVGRAEATLDAFLRANERVPNERP